MTMLKSRYNRSHCILTTIAVLSTITSLCLFLTFLLLLTTNPQFISFNQFSSTGKYPAVFFYVSIILSILYATMFAISIFGAWAVGKQSLCILKLFYFSLAAAGFIQVLAGIVSVAYVHTMAEPLREYMADNLRSNYTGSLNVGYLERQFDRSVDWVQMNYQCCGVISYEDYRNGYYYNTYNKYTIVNIVPNSCCIYREQVNQLTQCQMKSINIYRKGCYDILMWWMETFGIIIAALTLVVGLLDLIAALIAGIICDRLKKLRIALRQKQFDKNMRISRKKASMIDIDSSIRNGYVNQYDIRSNHMKNDYYDSNTLEETMSYNETKT